ncbi:hypothetical protein LguiB_029449 [Lonicera macranthoides]
MEAMKDVLKWAPKVQLPKLQSKELHISYDVSHRKNEKQQQTIAVKQTKVVDHVLMGNSNSRKLNTQKEGKQIIDVIHETRNDEFEGEDFNNPIIKSLEVAIASTLESRAGSNEDNNLCTDLEEKEKSEGETTSKGCDDLDKTESIESFNILVESKPVSQRLTKISQRVSCSNVVSNQNSNISLVKEDRDGFIMVC